MPCAVAQLRGERSGWRAQPVGIADRIPRPAGDGGEGEQRAHCIATGVGLRVVAQALQLDLVHAGDAGGDQQQRRHEPAPRQAAVAPRVQRRRAAAQVGRDRDHHRQGADDHRRQRPAGALDRRGEAQVVEQVADRRQLERLDPVGARELRQPRSIEPGERQRDQPEGQIARHREQCRGVLRQQQRHDEDEAPHEAGGEGVGGAGEHGRRSLSDGLEPRRA